MFGIGPLELMVILVLALIVFGPEKLPELMRSAGHAIREFQRYSAELTSTFQETTAEFTSAMDVSDVTDAVQEAVNSVTADVNGAIHDDVPTETVAYAPPADPPPVVVPEVSATTVPSEYETAAAMLDPVQPFVEPEPPPAMELEPAPVVEPVAEAVVETEPELVPSEDASAPPKPKRVRRKPAPPTEGIALEAVTSSSSSSESA